MAVGVCLAPIRIAAELIRGLRPLEPATWHAVTTPGTRAYHPLFGPLIVGELVTNAALLIWSGVVAMIAFMLTRVVVQIADAGVALMIPAAAARMGPATYGGLASGVLVALIWVPYLLKSRRVELTFVR